ncbi:hypothetical protein AB9K41_18075, partial [Cribrihabitans sp. XS_ASV171]
PQTGQENTLSFFPSAGPSIGTRHAPQRMFWVSDAINLAFLEGRFRLDRMIHLCHMKEVIT